MKNTILGILVAVSFAFLMACSSGASGAASQGSESSQDSGQPAATEQSNDAEQADTLADEAAEPQGETTSAQGESDAAESNAAPTQRDLPEGDYEELGEGTLSLTNQSGSTENGDEIIVYPDMDVIPYAYVDYGLWDMDGSVLTYIYLDGVQIDKQQAGVGFQSSIALIEDWQITEGVHKVEAVQYVENDPSAEMTFYRSEEFTVQAV